VALTEWMQPRTHQDAGRTLGLLIGVALVATIVTFPLSRGDATRTDPALVALAGIAFVTAVVLGVTARLLDESSRLAWTASPLLALLAITLIGLGTGDVSIGAQIFFVFCAVYGGALLRRPGAVVMTVSSILGEAVLVFAQLPWRAALNDLVFVTATLVTTAYLLGRGMSRVDRLVAELHERASTDSLTGLVNRRSFDAAVDRAVGGVVHPEGVCLILIDIDHFKQINDEFGHPGGDEVLVQTAGLVRSMARSGDTVCRLGGDELAVLLPGCTAGAGALRADAIVEAVRDHSFSVGRASGIRVSVSVGAAHAPGGTEPHSSLYAVADAALYAAKRAGRNRVVHADQWPGPSRPVAPAEEPSAAQRADRASRPDEGAAVSDAG